MKHKYQFPIESERLYYRPLTLADKPAWEAFFIDNPYLHFVGVHEPKTPAEESEIWLNRQIKRYKDTGIGMLGAIEKSTDQLIGNVGIIFREGIPDCNFFEIGYSVIPSKWKQGYASEMAIRLKAYFAEHHIDDKVISIIHIDNEGSQKVAENNGMKRGPQFDFLGSPCYRYQYHF